MSHRVVLGILVAAVTLVLGPPAAGAENPWRAVSTPDAWRVVSEEYFPPYNFTQDGKRVGIDVEIVDAVLRRAGVTAVHQGMPWNRVLDELAQNQTDLGFQFVDTPERRAAFILVGPHRAGRTVLMVQVSSNIRFETLEDLRGKTVGTVLNFRYSPEFDNADFIRKDPAVDNGASLRKLLAGRVDAVIGDHAVLIWSARDQQNERRLQVLPKAVVDSVPRFIAFPKVRQAQADRFASALEDARKAGEIDAIMKRWLALAPQG